MLHLKPLWAKHRRKKPLLGVFIALCADIKSKNVWKVEYITLCQKFLLKSGQFSKITCPKGIILEENT